MKNEVDRLLDEYKRDTRSRQVADLLPESMREKLEVRREFPEWWHLPWWKRWFWWVVR